MWQKYQKQYKVTEIPHPLKSEILLKQRFFESQNR
jgi:hypothetical protein